MIPPALTAQYCVESLLGRFLIYQPSLLTIDTLFGLYSHWLKPLLSGYQVFPCALSVLHQILHANMPAGRATSPTPISMIKVAITLPMTVTGTTSP